MLCPKLVLLSLSFSKTSQQLLTPVSLRLRLDQIQLQQILYMTSFGNTFRATIYACVSSNFTITGPSDDPTHLEQVRGAAE